MAHGGKLLLPPHLGPDSVYETWKHELEVWRLLTDYPAKKQGLALVQVLTGEAKDKVLQIPIEDLNKDNGLEKCIGALDKLYLKDSIDSAYQAYTEFDSLHKKDDESMNEFINRYERKYHQCEQHDMKLPDSILAFKLLNSVQLSQRDKQLVLTATADRKFETMKSSLKRIFGTAVASLNENTEAGEGVIIKQESAFMTSTRNNYKFNRSRPNFSKAQTYRRNYNQDNDQKQQPFNSQRGTNPLDRFGRRTRCSNCMSTFHWVRDCPDIEKTNDEQAKYTRVENDNYEQCNMALITKEDVNKVRITEALGCAVLDTACTKTVCGIEWYNHYINSIKEQEKEQIITAPSDRKFIFGDGERHVSKFSAIIPATIGDDKCTIETEVVDAEIPLLLSKPALKSAKAHLDLENDKATMFGKCVTLQLTSSGHYCVDLIPRSVISGEEEEILYLEDDMPHKEQLKVVEKLHKQFGHASALNLKRLIQKAGKNKDWLPNIIDKVVDSCEICQRYSKTPAKPVVSLPMSSDFNDLVAVDLHQIGKQLWYLHMIDIFTRFSAAVIVTDKKAETFVEKFLSHWIAIHGSPVRLMSDNGGEFCNKKVMDMCHNFNIEYITTPAYSPWSNGIVERHNQTLTIMMKKIQEHEGCTWEVALLWAVSAKNSLCSVHGFSAHQLVYGRNPNLPSVLSNKPPALEGVTCSEVVSNHVKALYTARRAFTETECDERLRRALSKQVRPSEGPYFLGDKVFYKFPGQERWKGPAKVIGQDGAVVFLKQAGLLIRVHKNRIRRTREQSTEPLGTECVDSQSENNNENTQDSDVECVSSHGDPSTGEDFRICSKGNTQEATEWQEIISSQNEQDNTENENQAKDQKQTFQIGDHISYTNCENGEKMSAKIFGKAGKAKGRNKMWFNIEFTDPPEYKGIKQSMDLSKIDDVVTIDIHESDQEINNMESQEEIMMMTEDLDWEKAKQAEIDNWKRNDVFEIVEDNHQKCISTRWVLTVKETQEGIVPKARLVARGFEEHTSTLQTDSPTCAGESLKLIMAIIVNCGWVPHAMDIKTAFLQGEPVDRNIFIKPPSQFSENGKLWRLKKCVYGLNDASLQWYNRVKKVMLELGGEMSRVDPAVFRWWDGELQGLLASHVDDFIWSGNEEFEQKVICKIKQIFHVGKEETKAFRYLGMELEFKDNQIILQQSKYCEKLDFIEIDKTREKNKHLPVTEKEKTMMRSKLGQVLWIAHQTRPDVLFEACRLSGTVKEAVVGNLMEVNKMIKQLKSNRVALKYQKLTDIKSSKLVVYSDASLGNLQDGGSQGAHVIFLAGPDQLMSPICWNSKKTRRVVRSTLAAETLAMADAIDTAVWIANLYSEFLKINLQIVCLTDCKSLWEAIKATTSVTEKRLRVEMASIKELLEKNIIQEIRWLDSSEQLADCMTKKGASPRRLLEALETGKIRFK